MGRRPAEEPERKNTSCLTPNETAGSALNAICRFGSFSRICTTASTICWRRRRRCFCRGLERTTGENRKIGKSGRWKKKSAAWGAAESRGASEAMRLRAAMSERGQQFALHGVSSVRAPDDRLFKLRIPASVSDAMNHATLLAGHVGVIANHRAYLAGSGGAFRGGVEQPLTADQCRFLSASKMATEARCSDSRTRSRNPAQPWKAPSGEANGTR